MQHLCTHSGGKGVAAVTKAHGRQEAARLLEPKNPRNNCICIRSAQDADYYVDVAKAFDYLTLDIAFDDLMIFRHKEMC